MQAVKRLQRIARKGALKFKNIPQRISRIFFTVVVFLFVRKRS